MIPVSFVTLQLVPVPYFSHGFCDNMAFFFCFFLPLAVIL